MDENELKLALKRLEEQQRQIADDISRLQSNQSNQMMPLRRDFWDRLSAVSPIISGLCIASGAFMCTFSYNQQQVKLQEAQTIEKFIPHLMGNETSKRMAILCLKTLVNTDLAAKYAAMFPSEGTLSALKQIAKTGDREDQQIISRALDKTMNELSAQKRLAENTSDSSADDEESNVSPRSNDGNRDTAQETSHKASNAEVGAPIPGSVLSKDSAVRDSATKSGVRSDAIVQGDGFGKAKAPLRERILSDDRSFVETQLKPEVEVRHTQVQLRSGMARDEFGSEM